MKENKHVCPLCDYVYDEHSGDPEQGISVGTKFFDLPADFRHADCAATKEMMEACSCATLESKVV